MPPGSDDCHQSDPMNLDYSKSTVALWSRITDLLSWLMTGAYLIEVAVPGSVTERSKSQVLHRFRLPSSRAQFTERKGKIQ